MLGEPVVGSSTSVDPPWDCKVDCRPIQKVPLHHMLWRQGRWLDLRGSDMQFEEDASVSYVRILEVW